MERKTLKCQKGELVKIQVGKYIVTLYKDYSGEILYKVGKVGFYDGYENLDSPINYDTFPNYVTHLGWGLVEGYKAKNTICV